MAWYSILIPKHFGLQQRFACNGTVIDHPEYGEVIQVQGDQRNNIRQFIKEVSCFSLGHLGLQFDFCLLI